MKEKNVIKYYTLLKENWADNCICLFLLLSHSLLSIIYPIFIQRLIDEGVGKQDGKRILLYSLAMAFVVVINLILGYLMKVKFIDLGQKITLEIKKKITERFKGYSIVFFENNKAGDVVSILENDVRSVQTLYTYLICDFLSNIFIFMGISIIMFKIDWKLTLVIIVLTVFFSLYQKKLGGTIKKEGSILSVKRGDILSFEHDYVSSYYEVKNLNRLDSMDNKLYDYQRRVFEAEKSISKTKAFSSQSGFLFQNLCLVFAFIYEGFAIVEGSITIGILFSMVMYIQKLYSPVLSIFNLYMDIQKTKASVCRVNSLLNDMDFDIISDNHKFPTKGKNITIRNVKFGYGKKTVLQGISISIKNGEKVAILGTNGKGKTTLGKLLLKSVSNYSGDVLVGDTNIYYIDDYEYHKHVIGLSQKVFVFQGTVYENVSVFNEEVTYEEVEKALNMADLYNDICQFPNGLNTLLGKDGVTLSGGQAQKLHLARLFTLNPDIIILDEPTSALDLKAEERVLDNLFSYFSEKTIIVISHRRKVLDYCNTIIDMDKLVEENEGDNQLE